MEQSALRTWVWCSCAQGNTAEWIWCQCELSSIYTGTTRYSSELCGATLDHIRLRTTLKFWSATMFEAAVQNFGPVQNFEPPTVIADAVPRATHIFSLASVGHVTGHMVSHMVPISRCRPPYWKIRTVNNLATVLWVCSNFSVPKLYQTRSVVFW